MVSLISIHSVYLHQKQVNQGDSISSSVNFSIHKQWYCGSGWKNTLNNLRLILQPILVLWSIFPWLDVFPNSQLLIAFNHLISSVNQYQTFFSSA